MTTILVTGGAGFIGNCFIRHILNKYPDYKIIRKEYKFYSAYYCKRQSVKL